MTEKQTAKVITKQRLRRKNPNDDVCNERRIKLLELILKSNSIRRAANELGNNNSTAKSIYYKYKQTGKIEKTSRVRKDAKLGGYEIAESTQFGAEQTLSHLRPVESNRMMGSPLGLPSESAQTHGGRDRVGCSYANI